MAKKNTKLPKTLGRPRKFQSAQEIDERAEKYFAECEEKGKPLTVTGLALALGTTRETLCQYEKLPDFSDAIKSAKTRVENFAEERLFSSSPTGAIFALKNFGWRDKPTIEDDEDDIPSSVPVTVKDARKPNADA